MIQPAMIHTEESLPEVNGRNERRGHRDAVHENPLIISGLPCITAALALISTRHLMSCGFHYPYHLLLVHALAILIFQAVLRLAKALRKHEPSTDTSDQDGRCTDHAGISRVLSVVLPCLHMACVVGTLLCVYQATFHFMALPALAMLLILDWTSTLFNTSALPIRGALLACISMSGMAMMFVFDRKLSKGGIIGSVVAIVLTVLARFMDAWMKDCCKPHARWRSPFLAPLIVVLISCAMISRYEQPIYTPASLVSLAGALTFNIISVVAAWWCNWAYFTREDKCPDSGHIHETELRHLIIPMSFVALVSAGSSLDEPPFMVSAWQYAGFLIAISSIYIASHSPPRQSLEDAEKDYIPLASTGSVEACNISSPKLSPKRIAVALSITLVVGVLCFLVPISWSESANTFHQATLRSVTALSQADESRSLDFVVSRFEEPATLLAKQLTLLLSLNATQNRTIRIVVYNTGNEDHNSAFHDELQHALPTEPQIIVKHRQNIGREGAAFLHHITSQWDNLADHTLFMQAELHQPWHVRQLLQNYFVPQTGFLSLSALRDFCASCEGCWDHSTWSEDTAILEDMYSRANDGAECKSFVLTYRGQFLASRSRIRAPGKELFGGLLDDMTDPKSSKHSLEYVQQPWLPQKVDSLNHPLFGYTLERMWGVLMRCSDRRLALTCPSMLASSLEVLVAGASELEDCQCLDEVS